RACMKDCAPPARVASSLPARARDAHGNLADQNRTFGPVRGADTRPPGAAAAATASAEPKGRALARASGCLACHDVEAKRLGPSFREMRVRYAKDAGAPARLAERVRSGSQGQWGAVPMPPQRQVAAEDADAIVKWVLEGAQ
ncbi:MAG TPA: c-type cytochrome, partial [Anaeromyxobacteraceae bacterium]|nr:c-type cytochrome [Anaeromyxobacteraceae bacterium]